MTTENNNNIKVYGTLGDVDPIEYGGGIVIDGGHGPSCIYFDSDDDASSVRVYVWAIPGDVIDDMRWADWSAVAESAGRPLSLLIRAGHASSPISRAAVMETAAAYYGMDNLDEYPRVMHKTEAARVYDHMFRGHEIAQLTGQVRNIRANG